jgi:hypothetical protein
MTKRYTKRRDKKFERISQDAYDTPLSATWPLFRHLPERVRFAEPCAGRGALIQHLTNNGFSCGYAADIEPRSLVIFKRDAMRLTRAELGYKKIKIIITNPPWTFEVLDPMIRHFLKLAPSWLLLDADWMHNKRTADLLWRCSKVVAVGRVKWIEGSKSTGFDNCCWYFFPQHHQGGPTIIGR